MARDWLGVTSHGPNVSRDSRRNWRATPQNNSDRLWSSASPTPFAITGIDYHQMVLQPHVEVTSVSLGTHPIEKTHPSKAVLPWIQ